MKSALGKVCLVLAGGVLFLYSRYLPFRKAVHRLHPSWKRKSKVFEFPPELEEKEELDLFISGTVLRDGCDVIWREKSPEPPEELFCELPYGTVVFVNLYHMKRFVAEVLPRLASPIVLVAGCDTRSPSVEGHESLYTSPNILHAFIQNCDFSVRPPERVTVIPVGLNFHKLDPASNNQSRDMGLPSRPGNQQLTLKALREQVLPVQERPLSVYANFHLNMDTFLRDSQAKTRRDARADALSVLCECPFVEFEKRQIPRNVVWQRYQNHSFEASPQGNGIDCHRTWEALLFKSIPIVKTSSIDSVFDGLPVAIVKDWSEVTEERLLIWREEFQEALEGPIHPKLYSRYWIDQFQRWKKTD
jgi:hypothetical protein